MGWKSRNAVVLKKDGTSGNLPFGTLEVSDENFLQIESAAVSRTGNMRQTFGNFGELLQAVIENPGIKVDLEVLYYDDCVAPDLFDAVRIYYPKRGVGEGSTHPENEFPVAPDSIETVWGVVVPDITVKWSKGGDRMLSFTVEAYDSMDLAVGTDTTGAKAYAMAADGTLSPTRPYMEPAD